MIIIELRNPRDVSNSSRAVWSSNMPIRNSCLVVCRTRYLQGFLKAKIFFSWIFEHRCNFSFSLLTKLTMMHHILKRHSKKCFRIGRRHLFGQNCTLYFLNTPQYVWDGCSAQEVQLSAARIVTSLSIFAYRESHYT